MVDIENHNDCTLVFFADGSIASEKKCADFVPLSESLKGYHTRFSIMY